MKIGEILREKQPKEYKELNRQDKQKERKPKQEHLSFSDIEELMGVRGHTYKRHKGAMRQVR